MAHAIQSVDMPGEDCQRARSSAGVILVLGHTTCDWRAQRPTYAEYTQRVPRFIRGVFQRDPTLVATRRASALLQVK